MRKVFWFISFITISCSAPKKNNAFVNPYEQQASRVTIIKDTWGIPHIYGKTDADAVFGLMYTECEENFERVERAYLAKLGRLSEVDGPAKLYDDLSSRMLYDTTGAIQDYQKAPQWLKTLCTAFADGVNYYLQQHPGKAQLLLHFQPWYPLLFTDGAFVALQTDGLTLQDKQRMYPMPYDSTPTTTFNVPTGSNGFAVAPFKTISKHALLYINPHVSYHYRMEAHVVSESGLNAYGAVTWGQFFVYQGFNEHCGWIHTSSMADAADIFILHPIKKENSWMYMADDQLNIPLQKRHVVYYKNGNIMDSSEVLGMYTIRGPVMGKRNNDWLSMKAVTHSLNGLIQSWQRMKSSNIEAFINNLNLRSNTSTNTMYADDKGNIAYWHGNFIPKRDTPYNRLKPVDGTSKTSDWQGIHSLDEIVHSINPAQGFLQNCNSTPFSVSGKNSLQNHHPLYMAPDGENFRSLEAIKDLSSENQFTLDKLIAVGYDTYLGAFDTLLPPLFHAYDALSPNAPLYQTLKEPIAILRTWDKKSSLPSIATTLAVYWGFKVLPPSYLNEGSDETDDTKLFSQAIHAMSPLDRLQKLQDVIVVLQKKFGSWKQAWGDINRYQRNTGVLKPIYDDAAPSFASPFASSIFGSLPAFDVKYPGPSAKKAYGVAGNSFVAAVEFGPTIKARAINQGGQSFDPSSKHFNDQTPLFLQGTLREVFFYKDDVDQHMENRYHPGENMR